MTCAGRSIFAPTIRTGDSVLLGSRGNNGSGKYMRIYDKKLEMMLRGIPADQCEDCIRYELELADEKAEAAWRLLVICRDVEEFTQTCGRLAVSGVSSSIAPLVTIMFRDSPASPGGCACWSTSKVGLLYRLRIIGPR